MTAHRSLPTPVNPAIFTPETAPKKVNFPFEPSKSLKNQNHGFSMTNHSTVHPGEFHPVSIGLTTTP